MKNTEESTLRDTLEALYQHGQITPFAWHFAAMVCCMDSGADSSIRDCLFCAAALTAHNSVVNKHVCLTLAPPPQLAEILRLDSSLPTPQLPAALVATLRSPQCQGALTIDPSPGTLPLTPLVLEGSKLYLQRYWVLENQLVAILKSRMASGTSCTVADEEIKELTKLALDETQLEAVQRIVGNRFVIVTGGPGTGKTTIVSVAIAALLRANPALEISLCAPTGKAQARMKEALDRELEENLNLKSLPQVHKRMCAIECSTIHRLLGARPPLNHFRHNSGNPLRADLLIVDEASMIDLALFVKLLSALKQECHVVLLGDSDQLAAVEIGVVLAEVCAAWKDQPMLAQLTHSHRFSDSGGIGMLKGAINAGDGARAWQILKSTDSDDQSEVASDSAPKDARECEERLARFLQNYPVRDCVKAQSATEAFELFDSFRILCATHHGVCGTDHVNHIMQKILKIRPYEHGWPLMVTVNDHARQLFNGDIGICLREPSDDAVRVHFKDTNSPGDFRSFTRSELPEHTAIFAMTVHKAQGSGFDEVLLMLPCWRSPILTRELLYTAVTRARHRCTVWADEEFFKEAVAMRTLRMSGVAEKLASGVASSS